jgi:methyl-accepting chemotaxis protein
VGDLVGEIAAASNEQAQGIGQVNIAVNEVDKITQQNAASAEESASASEEMSAQAEQMRAIVSELGTLVSGASEQADRYSATSFLKTKGIKDALHLSQKKQTAKADKEPALISHQTPETVIPLDEDFENF